MVFALPSPDSAWMDGKRITVRSTWGDKLGLQVFSEAIHKGSRIVFRFSTDPTLRHSIQSRIVTWYHKDPAADAVQTYIDGNMMRQVILWSITEVWNSCSKHARIRMPDVVVEIFEDQGSRLRWRLSHLRVYEHYIQQLTPLFRVLHGGVPLVAHEILRTVNIASLTYHTGFKDRGDKQLVSLHSDPRSFFVFKGVDFTKYLLASSTFCHKKDEIYHEIRTIRSLRPHPNIISSRMIFVTAAERSTESRQPLVCGTLTPYMKNRSLRYEIKKAIDANTRLDLDEKAKWCFQMISAITHVHYIDHSYHMDIRPSNFLIDRDRDLILDDWAQSKASRCTIAPEADGSSDAKIQKRGPRAKLIYKRYNGPKRVNNPSAWPHWNVFPIWRDDCSKALEGAEVFSLGRTMWMLLEQVDERVVSDGKKVTAYWKNACDIPLQWKIAVMSCLKRDPNKRPNMKELGTFWKAESSKRERREVTRP